MVSPPGYRAVFAKNTAVCHTVLFNPWPQGPELEKHPGVPISRPRADSRVTSAPLERVWLSLMADRVHHDDESDRSRRQLNFSLCD